MSAEITIDLSDVVRHGSVEAAITAVVDEKDGEILLATSRAMGGQTFATSGPGPGWSRQFSAADYAREAILTDVRMSGCDPSASSAIDPSDGRLAHGVDPDDGAEYEGEIAWEDDSCVHVEVPDVDEAIEHPSLVAEMAQSVIDHHGPESDRAEWRNLVSILRDAAEAMEDIDLDGFGD